VSVETRVARERDDAEGRFLTKALGENFFPTSAGYMECIAANGRHLGGGDDPFKAMARFRRMPSKARAPGAVKVPDLVADPSVAPLPPPARGLVLKIHARLLRRNEDGTLGRCTTRDFPLMARERPRRKRNLRSYLEASPDFAWITEQDKKALIPSSPQVGMVIVVPRTIVMRLCRFHLTPRRVYSEGFEWSEGQVHRAALKLVVEAVDDKHIRMRAEGSAHMGSTFDPGKATTPNGLLMLGYAPKFSGTVAYDRMAKDFTRFDLVALGDGWGRMGDANNRSWFLERPGRHPVGFAFELVNPSDPANRIVPMGRSAKLRGLGYLAR
jgi:hypothetical protein